MPGWEVGDMQVLNAPQLQPMPHNKAKKNLTPSFFGFAGSLK